MFDDDIDFGEDISADLKKIGDEIKFCIVCNKQIAKGRLRFCGSKECKRLHQNAKKQAEKETYPKYQCQHCGHLNQLTFDPRFREGNLIFQTFPCANCGKTKQDK